MVMHMVSLKSLQEFTARLPKMSEIVPLLIDHIPSHEPCEQRVLIPVVGQVPDRSPHSCVKDRHHRNDGEGGSESILGISVVNAVQNEVASDHVGVVWQPRALSVE